MKPPAMVICLETITLNVGISLWTHLSDRFYRFRFMIFIAIFNNISVISWQSVLLVEENGGPRENHWSAASHWQTLSQNVVSSTPRLSWIRYNITLVVIGTDCTGSCKSNYHTIMTVTTHLITLPTKAPLRWYYTLQVKFDLLV